MSLKIYIWEYIYRLKTLEFIKFVMTFIGSFTLLNYFFLKNKTMVLFDIFSGVLQIIVMLNPYDKMYPPYNGF